MVAPIGNRRRAASSFAVGRGSLFSAYGLFVKAVMELFKVVPRISLCSARTGDRVLGSTGRR